MLLKEENNNIIKITLIGDIFPGELAFTKNYGIRSQFEEHYGEKWLDTFKNILGSNDIVIGNLESPLLDEDKTVKSTFYGNPLFADFLKKCGVNVLTVANNHILEQENVMTALNQMSQNSTDIKILCFHWGNEYVHVPALEQRKMAYKFIDAGADIIVGHHPHVIQPYEVYKNRHIFYSLGNFIFDFIHSEIFGIGLMPILEVDENKQIKVNLNGVKLSYKNTVFLFSVDKFEKYYSKVTKLYDAYCKKTDEDYEVHYKVLLRRNHRKQRILMKIAIFKEFCRIRMNDKKHLLINVKRYYLGLLKKSKK